MTLAAAFEAQVRRTPTHVAVVHGPHTLTYQELNARANQLAYHLIGAGAGPDDLVALVLPRSLEMVVAMLGVLKAGAGYLPIDPAYPAARIRSTIADAGAVLTLVTEDAAVGGLALDRGAVRAALAGLPGSDPPDAARRGRVHADHVAYVIYTSGSTGRPKGVQVTHRNVLALFAACGPLFGFRDDDVWSVFHSYAFDFSVWELWGPLLSGGRAVLVDRETAWSPPDLVRLLADAGVTVLSQTPSAFYRLVAEGTRLPALRTVVLGGEALDVSRLDAWRARHPDRPVLVNMYGITETTVHVTHHALPPGATGSPIGRVLPGFTAHVLDDRLRPADDGELYLGGDQLARGYLGRPGLTAGRFVAGPGGTRLYRTGDLVRRAPDGGLHYAGRADAQVKIRGFRIEPGEIESVLCEHPAVTQCAVVVRDDRLIAYPVAAGAELTGLRAWAAARLPAHMVPAVIVPLDALPLTANSKLDHRALPPPPPDARAGRRELLRRRLATAEGN
ncbi:amino acid adenylation domain-containing protein [Catenuloplanes japonicus]|uniref:amino acid adenylation domain-containing protein n=1 Tax=Catenuloplanes japonicus TaxID=33876 RepID=UPI0006901B74|nr:amino acid adenylation domain-containing protein [Catenuloplanes japonicus]